MRVIAAICFIATCGQVHPQSLAAGGCPMSHCDPAATGVIESPLMANMTVTNSNTALGTLHAQGCSGNGTRLMCVYLRDRAPATRKGTLKALSATTLKPLWGSAAAAGSYDLDAATAADQVPVIFSDGSATAGDAFVQIRYDAQGTMIGELPLSGTGSNLGLTPLSAGYGVVSQADGVLTLVNLQNWQVVGSLALRNPLTQHPVSLIVPSSASYDVLYAVGYDATDDTGTLFSVVIDAGTQQLKIRSTFNYGGRSGAEPVYVAPAVSGSAYGLVLLHVPRLIGDSMPRNRLLGLMDSGTELMLGWAIPLTAALTVSPTVDAVSQSLFCESGPYVRQYSLLSGSLLQGFDLREIGGFTASFRLNGHLAASNAGGVFTLMLAGGVIVPASASGQFAMAFQPLVTPTTLLWKQKIATELAGYAGAWNFSAANEAGAVCPIVVTVKGVQSAITRLCDH